MCRRSSDDMRGNYLEGEKLLMSLNQILLIGNAGRDAELRYTQNGAAVANFSIAVTRRYQSRDEMREDTEWFNVSAWERQAENVAERVKRGSRVFVDGRLSTREYTSGNGETRTSLDVNANRVLVLTPRDSGGENANARDSGGENANDGYPQRRSDDQRSTEQSNGYGSNGQAKTEYSATAATQSSQYGDPNDLENLPW